MTRPCRRWTPREDAELHLAARLNRNLGLKGDDEYSARYRMLGYLLRRTHAAVLQRAHRIGASSRTRASRLGARSK